MAGQRYGIPRSTRSARRAGFSLVEVMVVVAIIALLCAILLPSLRKAREQSRQVVCLSNVQQLAKGWHQYLDAHEGAFLQGTNANWNYGGRQGSSSAFGNNRPKPLNRFFKMSPVIHSGADVFRCPADAGSDTIQPTFFEYYGTSYMTNLMLVGRDQLNVREDDPCRGVMLSVNKRLRGINRSRIANESRLILVGDAGWWKTLDYGTDQTLEWHGTACSHSVAFMDGHAAFTRIRKGQHTRSDYTSVPFKDLQAEVINVQKCTQDLPCCDKCPGG